jgi:hypothetical protein
MDMTKDLTTLVKDLRPQPTTAAKQSPALKLTPTPPPHDAIARRAYELYEGSGCPPGRDVEFWLAAERELRDNR